MIPSNLRQNIDDSTRIKLRPGDFVGFRHDNPYLPRIYKYQTAVVIERYKTLNKFNRLFWNYFTRIKLVTGPHEGRERSFVNGGAFLKKLKLFPITIKPKRPIPFAPDLTRPDFVKTS